MSDSESGSIRTIRTVDELRGLIGEEAGVSEWVEITQDRVNLFADTTGDHQYIHVDPERAAQTFFGGPVAHGFLTLSIIPLLGQKRMEGVKVELGGRMGVNYGLNKVRFPAPVRVGKRVRMHSKLLSVEEIGDRAIQTTWQQTIEVEGEDKPACVAETVGRTYF